MARGDHHAVEESGGQGRESMSAPKSAASVTSRITSGSLGHDVRLLLEDIEQDGGGGPAVSTSTSTPSPTKVSAPQPASGGRWEDQGSTRGGDVIDPDFDWGSESPYTYAVRRARNAFATGRTRPYQFRLEQLNNLLRLVEDNEEAILAALYADLRKGQQEGVLLETLLVRNEIRHMLYDFKEWMKPEKPARAPMNMLDAVEIHKEPYGVVLVLGTWNYPFHLSLLPLAGAVAAGNAVVTKPSEVAPESARVMADLIPRYLDKDCFPVVLGGIPETTELLRQKFDYIFYTGSSGVGKIVHAAASQHLTPVTLELGGKSPVWLGASADMLVATRRILWGKFTNAGQTCVAPDYLMCTRATRAEFLRAAKQVLEEFYGADPKACPDLGRLVSDKQFQRVSDFLKCGTVVIGGQVDPTERYISPTVLVDVLPDDPVMMEEVFGPVLPVYTVEGPTEAVNFINSRDKPLAMYLFTTDAEERDLFLAGTSCGGVTVNDTLMQLCTEGLPFGGVGVSGMGAYHGKYSFDTFSHHKGVLIKDFNPIMEAVASARYPPYSWTKTRLMRAVALKRRSLPWRYVVHVAVFGLGMLLAWALCTVRVSTSSFV